MGGLVACVSSFSNSYLLMRSSNDEMFWHNWLTPKNKPILIMDQSMVMPNAHFFPPPFTGVLKTKLLLFLWYSSHASQLIFSLSYTYSALPSMSKNSDQIMFWSSRVQKLQHTWTRSCKKCFSWLWSCILGDSKSLSNGLFFKRRWGGGGGLEEDIYVFVYSSGMYTDVFRRWWKCIWTYK